MNPNSELVIVEDPDIIENIPFFETEVTTTAVCVLLVAVLCGKLVHYLLQRGGSSLVFPPPVTAGVLCIGFAVAGDLGVCESCTGVMDLWKLSLDVLVNCVCASLFFSFDLIHRPFKRIWHEIIIQLMYGQVVSWGQYGVCTLTAMIFCAIDPEKYTPYMGSIVAMGMEGGQRPMYNLNTKGIFTEVHQEFPEAYAYAVSASNIGMLVSFCVGIVLLSWKKVWDTSAVAGEPHRPTTKSVDMRLVSFKHERDRKLVFESLTVHLGIIALSVGISFAISFGFVALENAVTDEAFAEYGVFSVIPIYPLCMVVATVLMKIFSRCSSSFLNLTSFQNIAVTGLELIVAINISMMVFPTFSTLEWSPYDTQFYITCFVCFIWNFFCLGFVSRRMCPNFWFIRGLVEFGEATGTFWTGMVFVLTVDPQMATPVPLAFAVKELFHGALLGGGLFTSFALVLENEFGPWMNFAIAAGFLVMWTTVFCLYYRHKFPNHTHVNLKKFNLMLRATQQRKKQKQGTQEQEPTSGGARGGNSMMPSSMSSTSMREIDGRDRSSSSPSGVAATTLAEPLTQHDARPDLEDGDSGNESSGGPLVVANGEDLHFFAENPVDIHGTSRILKAFHFASIRSALERRYQLDDWHCLYNLQLHGASITQCLKRVKGHGPTVLVMEDSWGFVSGVFISAPWIDHKGWFGNGETFCFTFEPAFRVFRWTGANENFANVDPSRGIGFGSGGDGFALWFDPSFENASTAKCKTFGNEQLLAASGDFGCITVEVWGLGRAPL